MPFDAEGNLRDQDGQLVLTADQARKVGFRSPTVERKRALTGVIEPGDFGLPSEGGFANVGQSIEGSRGTASPAATNEVLLRKQAASPYQDIATPAQSELSLRDRLEFDQGAEARQQTPQALVQQTQQDVAAQRRGPSAAPPDSGMTETEAAGGRPSVGQGLGQRLKAFETAAKVLREASIRRPRASFETLSSVSGATLFKGR